MYMMYNDQIRVTSTSNACPFFVAKPSQSSMGCFEIYNIINYSHPVQQNARTYYFYITAESKNGCRHRSREENSGYQRLRG